MKQVKVKILDHRLGTEFPLPQFETVGSAGMDIRACITDPLSIMPGQTHLIPSGLAFFLGDSGYVALLFARSGLAHKQGIALTNGVGVIDSDYQGHLMVSLSRWQQSAQAAPYVIEPGERIAQLVITSVCQPQLELVTAFEATDRGEGGLGHSGRH